MKHIKWLSIFFIVIVLMGCHKIDQRKFENLHHVVKQIEGSTMAGVNYMKFGELLQNLATELLITKDKVKTKEERDLLELYYKVYETYNDSHFLWEEKIENRTSSLFTFDAELLYKEHQLLKKYNIDIDVVDSIQRTRSLAIPMIWNYASTQYIEKIDSQMKQ